MSARAVTVTYSQPATSVHDVRTVTAVQEHAPFPQPGPPGPPGTTDASEIEVEPAVNWVGADVAAQLSGIDGWATTAGTAIAAGTAHIEETDGAHTATAISFASGTGLTSDNVRDAIDEAASMGGGGGPGVSTESFIWSNYFTSAPLTVTFVGGWADVPLENNDGVTGERSALPDGWGLDGHSLLLPVGLFSFFWYLEDGDGETNPERWSQSYMTVSGVEVAGIGAPVYPTPAWSGAYWSSVSCVLPVEGAGYRALTAVVTLGITETELPARIRTIMIVNRLR